MKIFLMMIVYCAVLVSGCRVSDVRTFTVKVPAMTSQEDVERVQKALEPLNGINRGLSVFDVNEHQVRVTYDSMVVAQKNIELAIAEAGFAANDIPAKVKLPEKK